MKILYIHQYFKTPEEGGAIRSYYIAKGFIENKWEVELISAHNKSKYEIKLIEGIKVHYLPVKYSNHYNFYSRSFAFIKFTIRTIILALNIKGINVCYATSTPLTVGIIAITLKKLKSIPYIFEVRDLWPEAPVQLNVIKNPLLKAFLFWFEYTVYKNAKALVALSPGIVASIKRKTKNNSIHLVPNMADLTFFKKAINFEDDVIRKKPFTIIYFGATGRVNRIYSLLEMAKEAKDFNLNIDFQVVGDGSEYQNLKKKATLQGLNNINFKGYKNKVDLRMLLQNADASFISYEDLPVLETSSPNKFFDSLAAGKLIILNIKGWLHQLCIKNKCGIYINHNKKGDFVSQISPFMEDHNLIKFYQLNARRLAEDKFSKEEQVQKIIEIIKSHI